VPDPGIRIKMTKGYRGARGTILARTDSVYEFFVLKLDNGISLVAGPSAFLADDEDS
jgi:hypothetical protein